MELVTELSRLDGKSKHTALTIGNFDGLHLGHQRLVKLVIEKSRQLAGTSSVFTFDPHPLKILAPAKCPPLISLQEEKIALFEQMGIDLLVIAPFSMELAKRTPETFVQEILRDGLDVKCIFVGSNYRYGKDRKGNIETLRESGYRLGFEVQIVDYVSVNGEIVSSTKIRNLIREGEVGHAAKLLGRHYGIKGRVVPGDARGRALGFPTANIQAIHEIIPAAGVYASIIQFQNAAYHGVVNIGYRPTFNNSHFTIEAHIFDFQQEIYGQEISLFFVEKIRKEKKFENVEALIRQIQLDSQYAKKILVHSLSQSQA